jgi:hypothetical protein
LGACIACNWPRIWSCAFSIDAIDDADDVDEVDDRIEGEGEGDRVKEDNWDRELNREVNREVDREVLQSFRCRNSAFLLSNSSWQCRHSEG